MPSILGNKINEQIQFQTELYLVLWGAKVMCESNQIESCYVDFWFLFWPQFHIRSFFYFPDYTTGNSWNAPNFIAFEIMFHIYSMKWIHIEVRMLAIDRRKDDINGSLLHFISICDSISAYIVCFGIISYHRCWAMLWRSNAK